MSDFGHKTKWLTFPRHSNKTLCFLSFQMERLNQHSRSFLGAAAGSPYIVFISTSGMLRSIYIYIDIYIICVSTQVLQHLIYTQIYIALKQNGYFSRGRITFRSVTPP